MHMHMKGLIEMTSIRCASTMPDEDQCNFSYQVGSLAFCGYDENKKLIRRTVSSITLQADVPGPSRVLERVCIWSGGDLLAEIPRYAAEHIGYFVSDNDKENAK
jgi:hypothetical protein